MTTVHNEYEEMALKWIFERPVNSHFTTADIAKKLGVPFPMAARVVRHILSQKTIYPIYIAEDVPTGLPIAVGPTPESVLQKARIIKEARGEPSSEIVASPAYERMEIKK